MRSYIPKSPKITSLLFLCNIWKNKWVMVLIFCMQKSMKASNWYSDFWWSSFCKVPKIANWWLWSSILKVFKVTSLQYFIISKKRSQGWSSFLHAGKHQSIWKLVLLFFMEVTRYVQITQSTSIVVQNIQIYYRGPVIFAVT